MFEADRASRGMGIDVVERREGHATARMKVRPDMVNGHGMAHGGFVFTIADTAFAFACNSAGAAAVAASAEITFVSPAQVGEVLIAEAALRTRFGRNGIYDVTVRAGDRVIAEFRGRSHDLGRPPGAP
ncbi:MAG: hydroxyphenylacetyl-CoA thioesterase PaaI [Acidimicrobiales bacterium]